MKKSVEYNFLLSYYQSKISSLFAELMAENNSKKIARVLTTELGQTLKIYIKLKGI